MTTDVGRISHLVFPHLITGSRLMTTLESLRGAELCGGTLSVTIKPIESIVVMDRNSKSASIIDTRFQINATLDGKERVQLGFEISPDESFFHLPVNGAVGTHEKVAEFALALLEKTANKLGK